MSVSCGNTISHDYLLRNPAAARYTLLYPVIAALHEENQIFFRHPELIYVVAGD